MKFKSILSLILAAVMIFSLAIFAQAAEPELKILVTSDIHYRPPEWLEPLAEVNNLPGDPLFYHANTKGMLTYEADAILDAFFKQAEKSGAKYLLIPGDMSEEGHWEEHEAIAAKLLAFQERSGIQVFVLPGNHDIRTSASRSRLPSDHEFRLDLEDFLNIYADLGFDKALSRYEGDASYTAELDANYQLLAIDACVYRQDESRVTPELFAWITAQCEQAKRDSKKLIAMTHYNVLDHFFIEGFAGGLLTIDQYRKLATLLADAGVKYVFTGHGHANDIAYAATCNGNKIFDIQTGSLITTPNAWREVTFSDSAVKIETKYVNEIDTSLLPIGFSSEQINAMQSNYPKYSFDFHRAGFRSYIGMLPDLTGTIANALKFKEGGIGWRAIELLVRCLTNAVDQPLDEYANLLDLAGAIYAGYYAGNESLTMNSREMRLLGKGITNIVPAAAWLPRSTKIFARTFVFALADGIFTDWSAPDDLNATLEPYGESWELPGRAVKITDFAFWLDFIWRILRIAPDAIINIICGGLK